jgi:hypothetical protein
VIDINNLIKIVSIISPCENGIIPIITRHIYIYIYNVS